MTHIYHTLTHHMKNIVTYTTQTHSRARVLAFIHHVYKKNTLSHQHYTHTTQMQRHRHILTHTEKQHTRTTAAYTHTHVDRETR